MSILKKMDPSKRAAIEKAVVVALFLLALVLFYFANKATVHYQQLYEKSTGKKVV